ncbi:MAG: hypothetical protein RIA69_20685 [Cyclobacteriaceae bacterium]
MKLILLIAFAVTCFNTGLIWIVQLVHYPGFFKIGQEGYDAYQAFHMRSITWIVAPSMLAEALTTGLLLFYLKDLPLTGLYYISVILLLIIWINTAFFAVPAHNKLLSGYDAQAIGTLVSVNWWRTFAWSVKSLLLGLMLYKLL